MGACKGPYVSVQSTRTSINLSDASSAALKVLLPLISTYVYLHCSYMYASINYACNIGDGRYCNYLIRIYIFIPNLNFHMAMYVRISLL